jgi:hypothetical protein
MTCKLLECRDTFSRPPCTLVQPSMQAITENDGQIPDFGTSQSNECISS